jgi:hypothetical protein
MTPPFIAEVTCQTSVLMNRNVTKMSSIGSARVASGKSSPRLANARLSAHPAMSCIRSANRAYAAATPATTHAPTANPNDPESLRMPTPSRRPDRPAVRPPSPGTSRGRDSRRLMSARTSSTK